MQLPITFNCCLAITFRLAEVLHHLFYALFFSRSWIQLDFLSLDCVSGESNFFNRVYVVSCAPMALALIIVLVFYLRVAFMPDTSFRRPDVESEHSAALLLLSFVVVPPCAMVQLQGMRCKTLPHDGSSFLVIDARIDCLSDEYREFLLFNVFFAVIYLFVLPMLWLYLLWNVRHLLNPPDLKMATALKNRAQEPELSALSFLFSDYRPSMW